MQINTNCNCPKPQPQFGMAFRKPNTKDFERLTQYARLANSEVRERGLEQLMKEQSKLKHFDIAYDSRYDTMNVIENATNKVVDSFYQTTVLTGFDNFDKVRFPGRKLFTILFKPKNFLPLNMIQAGERAQELETALLEKEASKINFNKIS